jgi:hypothetical protein
MKGRSGSTQEHASKEEVAPVGVIVIRTGNTEQSFHPAGQEIAPRQNRDKQ